MTETSSKLEIAIELQSALQERDAARTAEEKVRLLLTQSQAEQHETQDRQTQLQKEVLRLSDELKQARQAPSAAIPETVLPPDLTAGKAALEADRQALEAERQALAIEKKSLELLRQELDAKATAAKVPTESPATSEAAPSAKKPRATKSAGKAKKKAKPASPKKDP